MIFYNVFAMSQVFHEVELGGEAIEDAALAALSPYITAHINRLGRYELDAHRRRRGRCAHQRRPWPDQYVMFCGESDHESLPYPFPSFVYSM